MASQCPCKSYEKASVVKGHHVYKVIWTPEVGEELPVDCEYSNEHAITVLKYGEIVSHLLGTILHVSWFFLRRGGHIVCRVTGKRRHDDALEDPCVCVYLVTLKQ